MVDTAGRSRPDADGDFWALIERIWPSKLVARQVEPRLRRLNNGCVRTAGKGPAESCPHLGRCVRGRSAALSLSARLGLTRLCGGGARRVVLVAVAH